MRHVGGDQLEGIAISGEDDGFDVGGFRLPRQGADDVVGLPAGKFVHGYGERPHQFLDAVELRAQFRRSWRALGLVFGEPFVAERGRGRVESHGNVGGLPFVEGAEEHAGKPVHAGNVLAGAGDGQAAAHADGSERTVNHGVPIDQEEERRLPDCAAKGHRH